MSGENGLSSKAEIAAELRREADALDDMVAALTARASSLRACACRLDGTEAPAQDQNAAPRWVRRSKVAEKYGVCERTIDRRAKEFGGKKEIGGLVYVDERIFG